MSETPHRPPQQLGRGCLFQVLLFGLLIGAGMIAGGVELLWQVPTAYKEMQEVWTEAPGTILASRVRSRQVKTGNQPQHAKTSVLYHVELDYRYQLNGVTHHGTAPAAQQAANDGDLEETERIAAGYKAGEPVAVFYDPNDSTKSRLDAAGPNGLFWMGLLGGPLLLLCGAGLGWWSWIDWKAKVSAG